MEGERRREKKRAFECFFLFSLGVGDARERSVEKKRSRALDFLFSVSFTCATTSVFFSFFSSAFLFPENNIKEVEVEVDGEENTFLLFFFDGHVSRRGERGREGLKFRHSSVELELEVL